jgi:hypothetical protein
MLKPILLYGIIYFGCLISFLPIALAQQEPTPCPSISFADIDQMPIATMRLRFHFMPRRDGQANFTAKEASTIAENMLRYANDNLANLRPANIAGPKGLPAHVRDSRLRLSLYSETQTDKGVLVHEAEDWDAASDVYGDRVVNIVFVYCYAKNEKGDTVSCCYNQAIGSNRVDFCNVWKVLATDTAIQKNRSRLLVHELGHILGLSHTFTCGNECETVDIDPKAECGGGCEWVGDDCKTRGNNIMSYRYGEGDNYNTALTPCQWEKIFEHIIQVKPLSIVMDCRKNPEPLVIDQAYEVWQNLKFINRDIIILRGANLTIACAVRFADDCKIYVRRRGRLNIAGGQFTKFCDGQVWQAIEGKGKVIYEASRTF